MQQGKSECARYVERELHRLVPLWVPFLLQNWLSTCNNSLLHPFSIAYLKNLLWKLYLSVPPQKLVP